MEVIFSSTSKFKKEEFIEIVGDKLKNINIIYPDFIPDIKEIQGNIEEVAIDKAKKAFDYFKKPVIIDDESFSIKSLNGFPGPYLKDFEKYLKTDGIYELLNKYSDDTCFTQVTYCFTQDGLNFKTFFAYTECCSIKMRDNFHNTQDYWEVIRPKVLDKRLNEVTLKEFNSDWYMRKQALTQMIEYLNNLSSNFNNINKEN